MIKLVISDLDGTLFDIKHRLHIIQNEDGSKKKGLTDEDWERFNLACIDDKPIFGVIVTVMSLKNDEYYSEARYLPLIICTGRKEVARHNTLHQTRVNGIYQDALMMRSNNDYRPDYKVKRDMLKKIMSDYSVKPSEIVVFEDRKQVVNMWREEGCTCFQVAEGFLDE